MILNIYNTLLIKYHYFKEKDEGSTFRRSPSPYPSMSDISDLSSLIDFQDENQEMADLVSDLQPNLLIEYSDDEVI